MLAFGLAMLLPTDLVSPLLVKPCCLPWAWRSHLKGLGQLRVQRVVVKHYPHCTGVWRHQALLRGQPHHLRKGQQGCVCFAIGMRGKLCLAQLSVPGRGKLAGPLSG